MQNVLSKLIASAAIILTAGLFSQVSMASETTVSIHHPVINPTVPGVPVTAAYMTLKNHSNKAMTLIEIRGDISEHIELHEHTMKDGLMTMREVSNGINIAAKDETVLKPGGYHIMIMDLKDVITEGSIVDLTLVFNNGIQKTVQVRAEKPSAKSHSHHKHHKHH